jgi:Flp pilus assembly protein TadD
MRSACGIDWRASTGGREPTLITTAKKPRGLQIRYGILASASAILCATLWLCGASATSAATSNRERSDEIVKEAEAIVMAAGKKNPVDTAMINEAIADLHQALKIEPRNDSAYVDLGFCYSVLRDAETAQDMYRTATLINPSPGNFKELADIYLRVGNPEGALMAANAGLVKDPHNAKLYNAKGLALNDLQRSDEAEIAFKQAVKYDPNLQVARQNLDALQDKPIK